MATLFAFFAFVVGMVDIMEDIIRTVKSVCHDMCNEREQYDTNEDLDAEKYLEYFTETIYEWKWLNHLPTFVRSRWSILSGWSMMYDSIKGVIGWHRCIFDR